MESFSTGALDENMEQYLIKKIQPENNMKY